MDFSFLTKKEEKKVLKKIKLPCRNIEKNKKIMKYIKTHGVYGSMTTSPSRIKKISIAVSIILLSPYIKELFINIPLLYRNEENYDEKEIEKLRGMDRVKIVRLEKDIGPISKILPSLENIKDKKSIIISFDDDVFYPPSLINELIYYSIRYPKLIVGGAGFSFGDLEEIINRKDWPEKRRPRFPDIDVIEGWGAIAYRKELVDLELWKNLLSLDLACKLSDDLLISYSFSSVKRKRKLISTKYFDANEDVFPFDYGSDGLKNFGEKKKNAADSNMVRYEKCLKIINNKLNAL